MQHYRSFKLKCFMKELPTLSILKTRRPDLYNNPDWTCLFCHEEETLDHLWNCPNNVQHVTLSLQKLLIDLENEIALEISSTRYLIFQNLMRLKCWDTINNGNNFIVTDIMKCWVPKELVECLIHMGVSLSKARAIICKSLDKFMDRMYELIWMPQCHLLIQKELSVGIVKKFKCSKKYKYFNQRNLVFPLVHNIVDNSFVNNDSLDRSKLWCSYSNSYGGSWLDF